MSRRQRVLRDARLLVLARATHPPWLRGGDGRILPSMSAHTLKRNDSVDPR
jgi:hypothetical protein